LKSFRPEFEALREQLVAWRRDFHQHPEIAFEEVRTSAIVAERLHSLGLEVQAGVGQTGVIGILEGNQDGPTVLVRADMDALPIHEANSTDYISHTAGKMHACGHDAHTAIALSVATLLSENREQLAGRVKFIFQPAEEIGEGAAAMIADGALNNPTPDVTLGLHVWNSLPVGQVAVTDGPSMAGAQSFILRIDGNGGHAASPHETRDPVVAAAQIISAAQTIVSRNVSPLESGVISFTQVHGGDAFNVIPSAVEIRGTIRSYKHEIRDVLNARLQQIVTGIADAMGCTATLEILREIPPVVNDAVVGQRLREGFRQIAPDLEILENIRTMGSEDMAYFLENTPGTYFFVGSANSQQGLDFPHHHPRFDIDEDTLVIGASLLTSAIADYVWNN
jgi:amidohydrolase